MSVGRLTTYALPYANVVAAGVATNEITRGLTLENYQLKLGGTALTKAMLDLVRIRSGGRVIIEGSGTQLDKINAFRGITSNAAYLDVQFSDRRGYNEYDRLVGALDTTRLPKSLNTEVTITGATAPTLAGILHESSPQSLDGKSTAPFADAVTKILRYSWAAAVGGQISIPLPFGPDRGALIKRIHIEAAGDKVTGVTIKQNSRVIHESLDADNDFELRNWGLVPQALWYSIDFVKDGVMSKALDTRDANSLELLPTLSGADNGWVIVEYIDRLDNL